MPQSLSKIYIHLVFSTKGRTDTIPKQHLAEVHAYVAEIFNNHHCPAIQVGGTSNHIHILFLLGKTTDLAEIVRTVKSSSSRWINEKNGNILCLCIILLVTIWGLFLMNYVKNGAEMM